MAISTIAFRVVATAALFGVVVPLVMSVFFFSFGALVTIEHGKHPSVLEALTVVLSNWDWRSAFEWFYRGTLAAALGGAAFSAVFHRLAITGCSISMRDLRFYAGSGCVATSYLFLPLYLYPMPGLEIPFWIIIGGFSGGVVGAIVPKWLLPEIPPQQRDINV